ncbi:PREDICTED: mucin-5AC isoform X1 [Polistes canadensis]|uniref:mucin-5AC isoform X1 n=1 Tax=Polistes canadensis TaxID=91411 RepID=UPI000718F4D7|nr:PREDICTED: mucin-5AC isoform X1 [Polistes canadensis]
MATGTNLCLLFAFLVSTSAFSFSNAPQNKGRRLFGGYRIVPKVCQPTIPSRTKSKEPAICMFNYECTRRNGKVVGACMDGFLFGACCQLPSKNLNDENYEKMSSTENVLNLEEIDHVPDIPILLNPDGTPIGMSIAQQTNNNIKTDDSSSSSSSGVSNHLSEEDSSYTKITTFDSNLSTFKPNNKDQLENGEKVQVPPLQPGISQLEDDFPALLGQQSILDSLQLPGLLSHKDKNNNMQNHNNNHNDPMVDNPLATLLSPDQVLQIADPVDQLPALFSHGLSHNNHSSADTILLNENGTMLNETHNPDELFKPSTESSIDAFTNSKMTSSWNTEERTKITTVMQSTELMTERTRVKEGSTESTQWVRFPDQSTSTSTEMMPITFSDLKSTSLNMESTVDKSTEQQVYANTQKVSNVTPSSGLSSSDIIEKTKTTEEKVTMQDEIETDGSTVKRVATTPMTTTNNDKGMVRVPTITYEAPSGNKKNDVLDKEEIAINHIISILNDTTPGSETTVSIQEPMSSVNNWVNVEKTSKPSVMKVSSWKPSSLKPSTYKPSVYPSTLKISTLQPSTLNPTITTLSTASPTFYKPVQPSSYYNYETFPTETNYPTYPTSNSYSSRPPSTPLTYGSSSSFAYSSRPTTNPPAPTVIVLGPLGTEYTTLTTPKSVITKKPSNGSNKPSFLSTRPTPSTVRPAIVITKKPSVSTMITHNISTVISNVDTNSNHVVSTSYITVNLKDTTSTQSPENMDSTTDAFVTETSLEERMTTKKPTTWMTALTWSKKPGFYLKPSTSHTVSSQNTPGVTFVLKATTPSPPPPPLIAAASVHCDDETPAPDDFINFPPVRNPNLNISTPLSQQEKPTIVETYNNTGYPNIDIISENDIPTPTFIEDAVLTNKVDTFVNKIVESLQGNFQNLKDIVYNRTNGLSTTTTTATTTSSISVTKRPITTVSGNTTKKPTRRPPSTNKPSSQITTKKPATTKRPNVRPGATSKPISGEKPRPTKSTTLKPKPIVTTSIPTTKRPPPQVTTKRPKPNRKTSTVPTTTVEVVLQEEEAGEVSSIDTTQSSALNVETTPKSDFRTQCGVRPLIKSGRIVGGKGAQFGEWPWQVLVREATWLGLFTKNKCGGVLITDKYVITAAHCQPGFLASLVAVFGEFDISGELETKRSLTKNVRRVIVNRGYDPATFENDLALLELESPVQFDAHIVPICMPDENVDFTGRMATVTGWGRLKYNGGVPSVLQEVQVPIMENSVCQEMFQTAGHSKLILESFLCAGYANGQKDSCEGDSGGPLVMERPDGRWMLVGTVSHGIKCAAPYLPGVYMRTTYFKPWLHSITGV